MLLFHSASILWNSRWNEVKYKPYIVWVWFGCLTTIWSDLWLRSAYWSSCILKLHGCWNSVVRLCAPPVICRWWRPLSMFHRPRNWFFLPLFGCVWKLFFWKFTIQISQDLAEDHCPWSNSKPQLIQTLGFLYNSCVCVTEIKLFVICISRCFSFLNFVEQIIYENIK